MSLENSIPHIRLGTGILEIDQPIVLCGGSSLIGQGKQSTIIKPSANFVGSALVENSVPTPQENFCRHIIVEDVTLDGDGRAIDGISFNRAAEVVIGRVEIESCTRGIRLEDSIVVQLNNSRMNDNGIGLSAQNRITTLVVQSTRIRGSGSHNVEIDGPGSYDIQFLQAIIESSGQGSPGLIVGAQEGEVKAFSAIGSYFEANRSGTRAQIEFGSSEGAQPQGTFLGCYITAATSNVADYGIHLKGCRGVNIISCDMSAHDVASVLIDEEAGNCGYIEGKADNLQVTGPGKFFYRLENGQFTTVGSVRSDTPSTVVYGSLLGNTVLSAGEGKTIFVDRILNIVGNGLASCKGISVDEFEANNLTGSIQLVNGDATVVFSTPEKNDLYNAFITSDTVGQYAVANKTAAGFDIISSNGTSIANVGWMIIRSG